MLDIRATGYISPVAEVPFTDTPLTVHLVNVADETGLVTGRFRVYNTTTGALIHTSEIAPLSLAASQSVDVTALTDFDPPAPLDDTYFVVFDGHARNALVPDGIGIFLGAFHFDVKVGPLGPAPAAHAVTHEEAGADPIETEDLGTAELDATLVLSPDGAGGLSFVAPSPLIDHGLTQGLADDDHPQYQEEDEKGVAGGYCGLPNPLDTTLPLRADGTAAWPTSSLIELDFITPSSTNIDSPIFFTALVSGTNNTDTGEINHPGLKYLTAAPGANSGGRFFTHTNAIILQGSECCDFILKPELLASTTIRLGLHDSFSSSDATDGCYIEMAQVGGIDGVIVGKTATAGVRSTTLSSFTLIVSTWYRFRVTLNSTATKVDFFLFSEAGALLWTDSLTTNIPTTAGNAVGLGITGTRALNGGRLFTLDYIRLAYNAAIVR